MKPKKARAKIAGLFQYIIISAPSSPPPPHLVGTSQGMSSWQENMEGGCLGTRLQLLAKNLLLKRKKNNPSGAVMKEIDEKEEKLISYQEILDVVL